MNIRIDGKEVNFVTILILIDGFLQFEIIVFKQRRDKGHNPYFNRWFSAISVWWRKRIMGKSHNPYFNRWFSAIDRNPFDERAVTVVTILILIDGFLQ